MIGTRQKFLAENCSEINIQLDGHPISRVEHTKSLGLNIDDRLSWSNHIKDLCRKISSAIGALRRIRPLISQSTAVQIYNALIQPHFDYCAPVWDGLSSYLCEKLQKLQNRAARVILQANCEINSSLLLETFKWDKLSLRRRKQKVIMMFKSLKGLAPVNLRSGVSYIFCRGGKVRLIQLFDYLSAAPVINISVSTNVGDAIFGKSSRSLACYRQIGSKSTNHSH